MIIFFCDINEDNTISKYITTLIRKINSSQGCSHLFSGSLLWPSAFQGIKHFFVLILMLFLFLFLLLLQYFFETHNRITCLILMVCQSAVASGNITSNLYNVVSLNSSLRRKQLFVGERKDEIYVSLIPTFYNFLFCSDNPYTGNDAEIL